MLYVAYKLNNVAMLTFLYYSTLVNSYQHCSLDVYGYYVASNILVVVGSTMMSEAIVFAVPDIRAAYILIPAVTFIQFMFSGLFLKAASLPQWLAPFAPSISLIRWTMQGNFINQFEFNTTIFPSINTYSFYDAFLTLFGWGGKYFSFQLDQRKYSLCIC